MPFRRSTVCLAFLVCGLGVSSLQAAGDFSLTATPSSRTVTTGSPATYTVTVTKSGGFSGTVSFTTTGLPTGAGASYSPATVSGSGSTTLTVTTNGTTTPAGNSTLTIKGTSGSLIHTAPVVTLVVTDFSVATTPSSQTAAQGNAGVYSTTVTPLNGFSGTVGFTVSGLPANATAVFNPTSLTGSGTSVLTVSTSSSTPVGNSTLMITATSGTDVHTTTVTLIVSTQPIAYVYDDLGRLTTVVDPSTGGSAIYNYDPVGNLLSIVRKTPVSISSFSPTSGLVGTSVMIFGTGFSSTASQDTVKFNNVTATITAASTTQLTATVPTSATTGTISVTSPSGSATSSASFTVSTTGAPTISSFTPTIGLPETSVTITGTNFSPVPSGNTVTFDGIPASVYSSTATTINAGVPASAGSGKIAVQTASGQATSASDFVVVPQAFTGSSVGYTSRTTIGGSITSFTLSVPGQIGMILFDGTAGQTPRLLVNTSFSSSTLTVYNPDGSILQSSPLNLNDTMINISPALPTTGTYTILIAPAAGVTGGAALLVTIPLSTNDFSIFAIPNFPQTTIAQPSYSVFLSRGSMYTGGAVTLTVSAGLPTGASVTFSPASVTPSDISALTVNPGTAAGGSYTLTIKGANATQNHTTTAPLSVNPVPSPWTGQDIGSPAIPGLGQYSAGVFTIGGSGAGIGGTTDVFRYVSQTLTGSWSGTLIARVATEFNNPGNAQAGVMIRDSGGSINAFVGLAGGSLQFQYRSTSGGSTTTVTGAPMTAPYWVKLVKSGNSFSAYASPDGSSWVQQGSTQTISMSSTVSVGLAVSSVDTGQVTTATFDNVIVLSATAAADFYLSAMPTSVTVAPGGAVGYPKIFVNSLNGFSSSVALSVSGLPTGATGSFSQTPVIGSGSSVLTLTTSSSTPVGSSVLTITGGTHATTVTLTVAATGTSLPSPWTNQDIGSGAPGTGSANNSGTLAVTGTGCCLLHFSDSFQFAYYPWSGNGTIIAHIANESNPTGSAKAGVMIRDSLAPSSTNVFMGLNGTTPRFQYRATTADLASWSDASSSGTPIWIKLIRSGNSFSGFYSADGGTWIQQGATQTIPMANTVYVGLAVTSESNLLTSASFDNVSVTNPTSDYFLTTLPSTVGISTGGSVGYSKVYVNAVGGFGGVVNLAASGLPTGATGSFNPASVAGSGVSLLTITTTSATPPGNYPVTITGTSGTSSHSVTLSLSVTTTVSSLPASWNSQDVGTPGNGTGTSYSGGTYTLTGENWNPAGSADNLQFAYQIITGDTTIIARVASMVNPTGFAGLMIRESLDAGSTGAGVYLNNGGSAFAYRGMTLAAIATGGLPRPNVVLPYWLKLVRQGNNFSGYVSPDGNTWTQTGGTNTIFMADPVYVGLWASSNSSTAVTTGTFDNVIVLSDASTTPDFYLGTIPTTTSIAAGGSVGYPKVFVDPVNGFGDIVSLSVSGLPTGATASFGPASIAGSGVSLLTITTTSGTPSGSYPLTITGTSGALTHTATLTLVVTSATTTLPSPWVNQDIGTPGTGTGTSYSGGTYTLTGEGWTSGTASDNLQFAYQPLLGDGTIIARVASVVNPTGFAGLMIRESLDPGSRDVEVDFSNGGSAFRRRDPAFSGMSGSNGPSASLPYWLKLVRLGNNFTGYVSPDGNTWTQVGGTNTISMANPVYIGLWASSNSSTAVTTGIFDNVSVTPGSGTADFGLTATPLSTSIAVGGSVGYPKISVSAVNGFNGTVGMSVSGLPTGATATFSPASITGSGVSMLTITTTSATPAGTYPLTITGTSGILIHTSTPTLTVTTTATTLPASWTNQDVGPGGTGTGSSYSGGTYTVSGTGCCMTGTADSFQFAYQPMSGDGTILARVASTTNFTGTAQAGVMIRETLDPGSTDAFIGLIAGGNGYVFQARTTSLGVNNTLAYGLPIGVPYWVKLVRSGNNFTAYLSADGSTWAQQGAAQAIPMAGTVYVGLAVTSQSNSVTTTATFDNLSIQSIANTTPDFYLGTVPAATTSIAAGGSVGYPKISVSGVNGFNGTVSMSVSGLPTGATATFGPASITGSGESMLTITTTSGTPAGSYPLTITGTSGALTHTALLTLIVTTTTTSLPTSWTSQDIGPGGTGTGSSYSGGTYTVSGAGCCFQSTADSFQFAYQTMNGDGTIIARVASTTNFTGTAEAGVMIRETLDPGSTDAFIGLRADSNGFVFMTRPTALAINNNQAYGLPVSAPYWVKLVRSGNNFTAYLSADGSTWAQQGGPQAIPMAGTVYVGFAVASQSNSVTTTATFDNVSIQSIANTTPDFYLGTVPTATISIAAGGRVGYPKVSMTGLNGFNGTVSLSVSGLPTGATTTFSPASITGSGASMLTVTTTSGTPAGNSQLTITGTSGALTHTASLTLTVTTTTTTLPSSWSNQDIGPGGTGTGSSYSSGTYTVSGTGCCVTGATDSFQFAYQTLNGDGTIIARVASTTNFTGTAQAGVMIRETLDPGSTNAFIGLRAGGNGFVFMARPTPLATNNTYAYELPISAPYWFKLVRLGNNFSAYLSPDGVIWTQESTAQTVPMAGTVYVGLAVTSQSSSVTTTATFDQLSITQP